MDFKVFQRTPKEIKLKIFEGFKGLHRISKESKGFQRITLILQKTQRIPEEFKCRLQIPQGFKGFQRNSQDYYIKMPENFRWICPSDSQMDFSI